jgi:serine/threonine-protein kinase RsbW
VEVAFRLALPRDELSIPVVRRILDRSMEVLGVEPEDRSDITLAITDCCTNVLDHAQAGDD